VFFLPLYETDMHVSMLRRLRVAGVGSGRFLCGKILFPFAFRGVVLAAILWLVSDAVSLGSLPAVIACSIFCALYLSVLGGALSVCFGDGVGAVGITAVVGLLLCGGLVPRQMLSDVLLHIGDLTPMGAARCLLAPAFGAPVNGEGVVAVVFYTAVSLILLFWKTDRVRRGKEMS